MRVQRDLLDKWTRLLMVAVLAQACTGRIDALLASLPATAGGVSFDAVRVIDESYNGEDSADDVLSSLGKSRRDASIVYRWASSGEASIGALAVTGVAGPDLLRAVAQEWHAAAVISRTETVLGGRDVWLLEIRPDHLFAAYARGDVIYFVGTDDRSIIERILPSMP